MRIFLAAALVCGFAGAANAADCSALQIKNSIKTEQLGSDDLMLVPVTLDGVQKKFLFNTGAVLNQISRTVAEELKLPISHSRFRTLTYNGEASDDYVTVRDVVIGNADAGSAQLLISPNPNLSVKAPYDGVLASGFFVHDDVDLDFGAQRLNFFSTDHCEGRVVYWPHDVLAVVPMTMERGHIVVPVTLDGHQLTATINTGSNRTFMDLQKAKDKLGFTPSPDAPGIPAPTIGSGDAKVYPQRFASLAFAGVIVNNPMVILRPIEFGAKDPDNRTRTGSHAQHIDDVVGIKPDMDIGMDVLRHLHMYVAIDEQKLYITAAGTGESILFKPAAPAAN